MKKTLLITIDFPPQVGGVANYYFNLCKNLPSDKITVLTNQQVNYQATNFRVITRNLFTQLPIWPKWLPMFQHIKKVAKQEKIELLWVGQILPIGTVVYYLSKKLNIPYILSTHGTDLLFAQKKPRKFKMAQRILSKAKYITCNSQHTSTLLKRWNIDKNKIKVIYPGIQSINQQNNLSADKAGKTIKQSLIDHYHLTDKKILLSVCRLVKRKGVDNVIKALPRVWQQFPDLVYIIIGNGPDKESIKQKINKTKKQNIILLDNINDQEKNIFYELCDLFISPGRQEAGDIEGFGIVFLEAASYKKPSIASNIGGAQEAVLDNQTGLLVNPTNIQQIADAIIRLFKGPELAQKLGHQGQTRAKNEFSWEKSTHKFRQLLG